MEDREEELVEQVEEELVEQVEEVVEQESEAEVSTGEDEDVVARAKKYGHLSKDEWTTQGKDPNQWKSPEEFDKTGKILDQLYSLRKQVDRRDREIQALVDYQQRTSQREYERAKLDLEQHLKNSRDDMDVAGVEYYTKELTRLQDNAQQTQAQQIYQQQQEALNRFKDRNKHWFNDNNPDLMHRASAIDQELKSIYPNISYDELAQKIEARIQYEYPDRVGGSQKPRPAMSANLSSVNKTVPNKGSVTKAYKDLPQELKDTYNATKRIIEARGDREYTVADFIDRLKKDGEI